MVFLKILIMNNTKWFDDLRKQAAKFKDPLQFVLDKLFYIEQENKSLKKQIELYRSTSGNLPLIIDEDTMKKFIGLLRNLILERNTEKLCDCIIVGIHDIFKYDRAGLLLFDNETGLIKGHSSIGLPDDYVKNLNISPNETNGEKMRNYVAQCFTYKKTIFIDNRSEEKNYNDRMRYEGYLYSPQYALIPIYGKMRVFGVITIATLPDSEIFLSQYDIVLLEFFSHQIGIALENAELNDKIEKFYRNLILTFSNLIEFRDHSTAGHCDRLIKLVKLLAQKLNLEDFEIRELELAAAMHDIGKICTPDAILNKPAKLTTEEYEEIKKHAIKGSEIVSPLSDYDKVIAGIKHHHERWDGTGYPDGLKGEDIPFYARIIAVADSFDVMLNSRPYKKAMDITAAKKEILACSGKQFDPHIAKLLLEIPDAIIINLQK